jgi:hypothetical protein
MLGIHVERAVNSASRLDRKSIEACQILVQSLDRQENGNERDSVGRFEPSLLNKIGSMSETESKLSAEALNFGLLPRSFCVRMYGQLSSRNATVNNKFQHIIIDYGTYVHFTRQATLRRDSAMSFNIET